MSAHRSLLEWLGVGSAVLLVATLVALPIVIIKLPEDYFIRDRRESADESGRWAAAVVVKNLLGVLLIVVGIAMLVLPGQGLMTILFGIALTDFPGKFRLERKLVNISSVRAALDRIRAAAGRPPLRLS